MPIKVYNTLTRQKEPFETVRQGKVGMYVCGPTVYKPSHVGHMVGPVIFDTIKRYLTYSGYDVTLVINITDVDDKLIIQAKKQNISVAELAERITDDYKQNLNKLGVTGVDHMPKATEHIDDIVRIIAGLIDKGYAYPAGGDVYFDITKNPDYGKLCHRDPEQLEAGARIEVSDKKRNPGDFALWKGAKPGEPTWDSPWGPGRPGWHIECSAMSMKYLGQTLDIHGGGLDLQFPHHENELAQSESYTGVPFVRFWMHNGLMKTGDDKMSKSKGNEIVVSEVIEKYSAEALRLLLLSTHYRSPIEYSEKRLEEMNRALQGFYRLFDDRLKSACDEDFYDLPVNGSDAYEKQFSSFQDTTTEESGVYDNPGSTRGFHGDIKRMVERFHEHMSDDFNSAGAVGVLYDLLGRLNSYYDRRLSFGVPAAENLAKRPFRWGVLVLRELAGILGLFEIRRPRVYMVEATFRMSLSATAQGQVTTLRRDRLIELCRELGREVDPVQSSLTDDNLIKSLAELRAEARKKKNFALADLIRARLKELGVTLEDTVPKKLRIDGGT